MTSKASEIYTTTKAFKKLFLDKKGHLKPEAEVVVSYLRDVCCARGELGDDSSPYLYDPQGRFDSGAAAFLLGKRRVFDLIIRNLALNELVVFSLLSEEDKNTPLDERTAKIIGS